MYILANCSCSYFDDNDCGRTMVFGLLVVGRSLREVNYTGVNVVSEQQRSSVDWSITACGGSYEVGFGSTTSLTDVFPDALYQAMSPTGIREQS